MANQTRTVGEFANGSVLAQVVFNDANGNIGSFRVVNNSASPAHMEAHLNPPINGFSVVGMDAPAHATTSSNLPNNVVNLVSLQITDPETGLTNAVWSLPGGISLFCRWPA